jgi:hypothetical protein
MKRVIVTSSLLVLGVSIVLAGAANANGRGKEQTVRARLIGVNEVPSVSTQAQGWFRAKVDENSGMITYWLSYAGLEAPVQQAHLHFGQHHTNGGVSVFLCTNLGNGPAGTQACPAAPAVVTGAIMMADVIGPGAQGIAPGEFAELLAAIRAGAVYANVHTEAFPGGEIRGQLR